LKHGVLVAAAQSQSGRCPHAAPFRQAAHDLDNFVFVQTQADEAALLVECFPASGVEATEALHCCQIECLSHAPTLIVLPLDVLIFLAAIKPTASLITPTIFALCAGDFMLKIHL
jgi:hypothetical protein